MKTLQKRKPNRLKGYDYSRNGCYFITVCTKNRDCLFGDIVGGEMRLNEYGIVANDEIARICEHYTNVKIDTCVVMPNHIHLIVVITGNVGAPLAAPSERENAPETTPVFTPGRASAPPTVGNIVRGYKAGVSRNIGFSAWQRSYHDHIIRNEKSYHAIYRYIKNNPALWEADCHNPLSPKYKDWKEK
jgi:REP element-mobilizing transposase RayT